MFVRAFTRLTGGRFFGLVLLFVIVHVYSRARVCLSCFPFVWLHRPTNFVLIITTNKSYRNYKLFFFGSRRHSRDSDSWMLCFLMVWTWSWFARVRSGAITVRSYFLLVCLWFVLVVIVRFSQSLRVFPSSWSTNRIVIAVCVVCSWCVWCTHGVIAYAMIVVCVMYSLWVCDRVTLVVCSCLWQLPWRCASR